MRISTFFYTIRQGFRNIFRNKLFSLASIATITACLFLFGVFYAIVLNLQNMVKTAEEVRDILLEKGISPTVINGRFIKPIDEEAVAKACSNHKLIVTMEENVLSGGYGEAVALFMKEKHMDNDFYPVAIPDRFIEHGSIELLKQEIGMDAPAVAKGILERMH